MKRRHLTAGQRDFLGADVERLYAEEAKRRVGGRPRKEDAGKPPADLPEVSPSERESRERAAKVVGASGRGVSQAKRLEREAPDLRAKGHSERAIAGALGVSQPTVHRDLERASQEIDSSESISPDRVQRRGGGTYPARRPTVVAARNEREAQRAQEALATLGRRLSGCRSRQERRGGSQGGSRRYRPF